MNALDVIKYKIKKLYNTNPNIHVNVSITRSKVALKNEPAIIKNIYPHIFQIEEHSSGAPRCHTLQYSDILTKQIEIVELGVI